MAALKEMRYLKEEEKTIKQLLEKFQDQLNRLKVEELTLKAQLRAKDTIESDKNQIKKRISEINVKKNNLDSTTKLREPKEEKLGMESDEVNEEDDDYTF